jgi:hypothetical protein
MTGDETPAGGSTRCEWIPTGAGGSSRGDLRGGIFAGGCLTGWSNRSLKGWMVDRSLAMAPQDSNLGMTQTARSAIGICRHPGRDVDPRSRQLDAYRCAPQ